jgi:EcsC protein family
MLRQAIFSKVVPDAHRMAPELNGSLIRQAFQRAVQGVGPLPSAASAAEKQLQEQDGDVDKAVLELIENHAGMAAAQGFATNIGGLVTMAATVPVNITGLALIQCRLAAGIAHLRGYDLSDGRVRNAILLSTLGEDSIKELVKKRKIPGTPMVIATAPAYDPGLDKLVAAEVTAALVNRVLGKRAASTVVRRIPVAGGVWGAGTDGYATWQVGKYAARELRTRTVQGELVEKSGWRRR